MAYDPNVIATIIRVGRQRGLGAREITAALATGIVESGLQNLRHGDRDSQGVFQQRPSQGWGTVDQVTNVEYAAGKFYDAIRQFDKPGISGAELAARIQRPAAQYRGRYAERWADAQRVLGNHGGKVLPSTPAAPSFPVPGVPAGRAPAYTVPQYPTTPLPVPAAIQAQFAERAAAARRAVEEAKIGQQRGSAEAASDFSRFLKDLDRRTLRESDAVMDRASSRNLAFQPAFVAPRLTDVREQASAAQAEAVAAKQRKLATLAETVRAAEAQRGDIRAGITRDRARVRSDLDRLIGL